MSMYRKTITLTAQQNTWVREQVDSGHYGNDSEYIRELIRKDQLAKEQLATLRQALMEGETSGQSKPFDIANIKSVARKRMLTNNS